MKNCSDLSTYFMLNSSIIYKRTIIQEPICHPSSMTSGTYCIVETVVPSRELQHSGEQLCVLLGFRTTYDNCVDTLEADSERSQEARSWRDWTGIGTLYQNLSMEHSVEVTKIEFLESHVPYHSAIFHYIVLVYLQVCNFSFPISSCAWIHKLCFQLRPRYMYVE